MRPEEFTARLKNIDTPEKLNDLIRFAGIHDCTMENRRTRKEPFHFTYYRYYIGTPDNVFTDTKRCSYLYNDGFSHGKCKWENLHRTFKFRRI